MAFWVYLLRCADGKYYTGHTDDLERRVAEHQSGAFPGYTSKRRPVTLVWSEYFQTRTEALEAERVVGGWSKGKKEALIANNWSLVSYLAKPPKARQPLIRESFAPLVSSEVEKPVLGAGFSTSLETNGGGVDRIIEGGR